MKTEERQQGVLASETEARAELMMRSLLWRAVFF